MPPTSRQPRSRQAELFPRSKRTSIEIAPNHRLAQIAEEIDWTELEELVQAIRLSKLKNAAGRPPHLRALIGALVFRALRYRTYRELEDLIRYYAPARLLCGLTETDWSPDANTIFPRLIGSSACFSCDGDSNLLRDLTSRSIRPYPRCFKTHRAASKGRGIGRVLGQSRAIGRELDKTRTWLDRHRLRVMVHGRSLARPRSGRPVAAVIPAATRHHTHAAHTPSPTSGTTSAGTVCPRRSWSLDHRISAREVIQGGISQ